MLYVTNEKIRVKALECYSKFVKLLTPEVIQESIIPALTHLRASPTITPTVKVELANSFCFINVLLCNYSYIRSLLSVFAMRFRSVQVSS